MQNNMINTINRINQMEFYFDTIQNTLIHNPDAIYEDILICNMLEVLTDYYENGQWLADYKCDERGVLPQDLKRGVLSQDAIYNLLCDIKNI